MLQSWVKLQERSSNALKRKFVFIGIDGGMYSSIKKYAEEGLIPNIASLIEEGAFFRSLPSIPVDTPTNWTTLMTSSSSFNHGVVSFSTHLPGERAEEGQYVRRTQHSSFVNSEMLWSVLENSGWKVAVLNYPVGWPSQLKNGAVIGGLTPGGDLWRIAKPKIFSTGQPEELRNDIKGTEPAFAKIDNECKEITIEAKEGVLKIALECIDSFLILKGHDFKVMIKEGEWSEWIYTKIGEKNSDCKKLTVYLTQIFSAKGWCSSPQLENKVTEEAGPYMEGLETPFVSEDPKRPYGPSNLSPDFVLEHASLQSEWFHKAGQFLLKKEGFDSLIMHYHLIDSLNHTYLSSLCRSFPGYDEKYAERVEKVYSDSYRIIDDMIGKIVSSAGKDAIIVVTSDHSALPCWNYVSVEAALASSGLMEYDQQTYEVDMKRSKVFVYHDPLHLWVNLKGREKNGIVERWEYEAVLDAAIDALYSIRDNDNGERVIKTVLKKQSLPLGKSSDRFGDAFFFFKPTYSNWDGTVSSLKFDKVDRNRLETAVRESHDVGGHHTTYLPSESYEGFENYAFTIMSGKGIANRQLQSMPELRDIAITVCNLLDISAPRDADGRVIYEIL